MKNETVYGEIRNVAGTYEYMAPEVFTSGEEENGMLRGYGRASDIWSVGCVVLFMLTGRQPWKGMGLDQIIYAVGSGRSPEYDREAYPQ